jgi:hypothetical protein
MIGVRLLDMRVSYDPKTKDFYVTHTLTCMLWSDAATQIANFLRQHPSEVVVVVVGTDWHHRKVISTSLIFLLENIDYFVNH